jgi:protein required for attachment to host cells
LEHLNLHEKAESDFIKDIAKKLSTALSGHPDKRVVIVAPPRALGVFRKNYVPTLMKFIMSELDKDWVNEPIANIERQLFGNG